MFEKLYYGHFKLGMNCREFDVFIQETTKKIREQPGNEVSGYPVYTIDEFLEIAHVGLVLLKSDVIGQIIGVGYRDADFSRAWMAPTADHVHTLFLDCPISMVEGLGLKYEAATGHIISPMNDNKIVLKGSEYK